MRSTPQVTHTLQGTPPAVPPLNWRPVGQGSKMKTLYIVANCMLLCAIACDATAESYCASGMRAIARATAYGPRQGTPERETVELEAGAAVRSAGWFKPAGLLAAGIGVASWVASVVQGKRSGRRLTPVIPWVLFLTYAMVFQLVV